MTGLTRVGETTTSFYAKVFTTMEEALDSRHLEVGDKVFVTNRTVNGGAGEWSVVDTTSVTPNGMDLVQFTSIPTLTLALIYQDEINILQLGAAPNTNIVAIIERIATLGKTVIGAPLKFTAHRTIDMKGVGIRGNGFTIDFIESYPTGTTPVPTAGGLSWSVYNEHLEICNFTLENVGHVGIIGRGHYTNIHDVTVLKSFLQGINWQGTYFKIHHCYVDTVDNEFGILATVRSANFVIHDNIVRNVAKTGAFELGYQYINAVVKDNQAYDCFVGYQSYPNITDAQTQKTMRNVVFEGNSSYNCQFAHYHFKNEHIADGIVVEDVTVTDPHLYGGAGVGFLLSSTNTVVIEGGSMIGVAGHGVSLTGGVGECVVKGLYAKGTGASTFANTSQDNLIVTDCRIRDYTTLAGTAGANSFTNVVVEKCRVNNVPNAHANLTELTLKFWNTNNFELPFTSVSQLQGTYPIGYRKYYTNPTAGAFIGLVCIAQTGNVANDFKTFGAISA